MDRQSRYTIRAVFGIFALLILFQLGGCAIVYSSADVEGRIVDADTGEPVTGAVVIGIWQLESYPIHNHYMEDIIHVSESVSDEEGRYRLEGFDLKWVLHKNGSLYNWDPNIVVAGEGYLPTSAYVGMYEHDGGPYRHSPLNGRDITVEQGVIDSWDSARRWSGFISGTLEDMTCDDVHRLPNMMELFGRIEPQYKQYYDGIYGGRYKNTVKNCIESPKMK